MQIRATISAATREDFRRWLILNHRTQKEVWLAIYKKTSGKPTVTYGEAVGKPCASAGSTG